MPETTKTYPVQRADGRVVNVTIPEDDDEAADRPEPKKISLQTYPVHRRDGRIVNVTIPEE